MPSLTSYHGSLLSHSSSCESTGAFCFDRRGGPVLRCRAVIFILILVLLLVFNPIGQQATVRTGPFHAASSLYELKSLDATSCRQFVLDWSVTTYPPLTVAPGDELTFIFETGAHTVYRVKTQEEFDTCNMLDAQVVIDTSPLRERPVFFVHPIFKRSHRGLYTNGSTQLC